MSVGSLLLVGLRAHAHLKAVAQQDMTLSVSFSPESFKLVVGSMVPVCEGVVDYRLQQQSVSNLRRSSEGEHVNGPQSRMSPTETTAQRNTHTVEQTAIKILWGNCKSEGVDIKKPLEEIR